MAFELASDIEQPVRTTVGRYSIFRLGDTPMIQVQYAETVDMLEPAVLVESIIDELNNDKLEVPVWKGRTDLVGKQVFLDNAAIGTITGIQTEVKDGETVVTPEVIVLDQNAPVDIVGKAVSVVLVNATGSVAHKQASAGRSWEVNLPMVAGASMDRANQMLIAASVGLVKTALETLGDTTTTVEQVQNAIVAMAQSGVTVDSFLTSEAEKLEKDRQAGLLPFVATMGQAPRTK